MRSKLAAALLAGTIVGAASLAIGQSNFPAPGGQNVPLAVQGCLNALGQAVACGSAGTTQLFQIVLGTAAANIATGSTGAVTATLAGAAGKTTYVCHVDVSAAGGTANPGPITITGLLGGTATFQIPANASTGTAPFQWNPTPCWPASAQAQAIAIVTTADGTASAVDVNALGYQQ